MELVRPPHALPTAPVTSEPLSVDVAVVGSGPTGAMAALGAAQAGWRVALVAPDHGHDPRTTALLMPSVRYLSSLGVWESVAQQAAPLATMRLIDDTDRIPRAPEIAFNAHELNLDQFGFNIANDDLNGALATKLDADGVIRVTGKVHDVAAGMPAKIMHSGGVVHAPLVVAADGSQSTVRAACGIAVREWSYDQAAFVTTLSHSQPHGDTSTEFHTAAGPFTLVPLPGRRSSLVWVSRPDEAERIMAMQPGPLARAIESRAHHILGRMTVDGPRGLIPMRGLVAERFGKGQVVLVGEAAHRFPPIGAQGLNLGVRDASVLRDILVSAKQTGALDGVVGRYHGRRRVDVGARTLGVDLLNRSLLTDMVPITVLRSVALSAARGIGPLRRAMMQFGLGASNASV